MGPWPRQWGGKWKQEEKGGKQEPGRERQGEAAAPSRDLRIYLSPASQAAASPFGIIPKHSPPHLILNYLTHTSLLLQAGGQSSISEASLLRNDSNSDAELICPKTLDSA